MSSSALDLSDASNVSCPEETASKALAAAINIARS
jgi:hypothetical protein